MSYGYGGRPQTRRAPRLGPDQFIAPHMTRLGRFRKVNPLKPRALPSVSKVLGVLGWAVLVEESLRRARKASKADPGAVAAAATQVDPNVPE